VDAAARQILALGEKSQRIGDISRIATEVADRIHLLAINAAIEAAGAGEYGRRFAVVASQVKELANATRQSSVQIQQLIDEMRNATNSAIMVTEQATKQIEVLSVTAERTRGALEEIVQRVETIALATHQQRTASEQVVGTMHQVAEVTRQSAQSSRETLSSAESLDQAMHGLRRLIGDKES
jgi:methyl-accepting chemotaxis protein